MEDIFVNRLILSLAFVAGIAAAAPPPIAYPYKIVTTIGMVNDMVSAVAGDLATCEPLIGAGIDPHLYTTTRGDMVKLLKADAVFYCGLMLEGRMSEALEKVGRRGRTVFAVTDGIDKSKLLSPEDFEGHHDPHVWMDVKLWIQASQAVEEKLASFDPKNTIQYAKNQARYAMTLEKLDAYVKRVIGTVPEPKRVLVTAHDAFNYFGRAYNMEVLGIQGISTESEAGLRRINQLVISLSKRRVRAVFMETSVSDRNVRALIEGTASMGHIIKVGGELFSDAMGPAGTYEGSYIGMLDHNATTIARALGGEAPVKGFMGKLRGKH
ncbi:MAG: manganese/zinc/iron transport system substrate-binding protein [Rhodothermales bacterium]